MTDNALIPFESDDPVGDVVHKREMLVDLIQRVFVKGTDFGRYGGIDKDVLHKPGAEKICSLFRWYPEYETVTVIEDFDKPLFFYRIRCYLIEVASGLKVGSGIGSCNSMEDNYRWRQAKPTCPQCGEETIYNSKQDPGFFCWKKMGGCGATFGLGDERITKQPTGRVPNDGIYTLVNTFDKMSQKRAFMAAVITTGLVGEFFTQDIDDYAGHVDETIEGQYAEKPKEPEITLDAIDQWAEEISAFPLANFLVKFQEDPKYAHLTAESDPLQIVAGITNLLLDGKMGERIYLTPTTVAKREAKEKTILEFTFGDMFGFTAFDRDHVEVGLELVGTNLSGRPPVHLIKVTKGETTKYFVDAYREKDWADLKEKELVLEEESAEENVAVPQDD